MADKEIMLIILAMFLTLAAWWYGASAHDRLRYVHGHT